jgi:SAM-dependent methyltransferase
VCLEETENEFVSIAVDGPGVESHELLRCPLCGTQFWNPFENPGAEWYAANGDNRDRKRLDLATQLFATGHSWNSSRVLRRRPRNERILELGCGTGALMLLMQRGGNSVTGVDFDPEEVEIARSRGLRDVVAGDIMKYLGDSPESFDTVVALEVLEHLDNPLEFLRGAGALLRPGGALLLSVPNRKRHWSDNSEEFDRPPHHLSRFDADSLEYLLRRAGYASVRVREQPYDSYLYAKLGGFLLRWKNSGGDSIAVPATASVLRRKLVKFYATHVILAPLNLILFLLGYRGAGLYAEASGYADGEAR